MYVAENFFQLNISRNVDDVDLLSRRQLSYLKTYFFACKAQLLSYSEAVFKLGD